MRGFGCFGAVRKPHLPRRAVSDRHLGIRVRKSVLQDGALHQGAGIR